MSWNEAHGGFVQFYFILNKLKVPKQSVKLKTRVIVYFQMYHNFMTEIKPWHQ